jgi:hypothetical protein
LYFRRCLQFRDMKQGRFRRISVVQMTYFLIFRTYIFPFDIHITEYIN